VGDNVRLGIDVFHTISDGAILIVGSKINVGLLLLFSPGMVVGSSGVDTVGNVVDPGARLVEGVVEGKGADDMLISII
jgi:hypothetical protein